MPLPTILLATMGWTLADRPWMDSKLPIDQRVDALLPKLSIEELSAQVRALDATDPDDLIKQYGGTGVGTSTLFLPEDINRVQDAVLNQSRWGIPVIFQFESLHSGGFWATVFPMPLSLGATWNESLLTTVYDIIGNETRRAGARIGFAPVVNLFPDPRYGRFQESLTPDPALMSLYTKIALDGLQGGVTGNATQYLPPHKVAALAKHFAGYGGGAGGLNCGGLHADEREVRDVYLRPWRVWGKYGGRGAMPAHQTVFGIPMHAHNYLINKVFRRELGFGDGLTISDCNDIGTLVDYRVAVNRTDAAAKALKAGVDQDLQCGDQTYTYENIQEAINLNLVDVATLRTAVRHVLTVKFSTGLFDNPYETPYNDTDPVSYRKIAREAAEQSSVLLQNIDSTLPLPPGVNWDNVAMIGWLATDAAYYSLTGPYSSIGAVIETYYNSTFAGLGVSYSQGAHPELPSNKTEIDAAVALAKKSSHTIMILGDSLNTCGEWIDRSSLDLPGGQMDLLREMVSAKVQNLILVVVSGRPVTFGQNNSLLEGAAGLVWVGRPGEAAGSALYNILTGEVNPSGKLQSPWIKTVGHVYSGATPFQQEVVGKWVYYKKSTPDPDGRVYDSYVFDDNGVASPLFHFGFGLSYTTFVITDPKVLPYNKQSQTVTVMFTVENTGSRPGAEVVQIYLLDPVGSLVVRPWKRLVKFSKNFLNPAEATTASVVLSYDELAMTSVDDLTKYEIAKGLYTVRVGSSSYEDQPAGTFFVSH